ncbi:MAG TPA: LamG domain-containing protein [Solirubrobacteraceae bacterium]|nr:LamG domain-containing protein [Solirubrobacteraceae bacterium]
MTGPTGGGRAGARLWALLAAACALLVAMPAPTARAADATLVGHWPLDAGGADTSGSGNDVVLQPGTPFDPAGRLGQALDETMNLWDVRVPATAANLAALEPARVTLSAWVKRAGGDPGGYRFLVAKGASTCTPGGDGSDANPSYALATDAGGDVVFMTWDGIVLNATQSPAAPAAAVFDGTWHSLVGVFDGTKTRLYLDGAQVGDGASGTASIAYGLDTRAMTIGSFANAGCPGHFPASIDDVRVYSRALGADDVAALARGEEPVAPAGPPPVQPPVNTVRPSIGAERGAAGTYRCDPGTWTGAEGDFQYAWRDLIRGGTIATTPTFTPKPADYGYTFSCSVTASNAGGQNTATSDTVFFTSAGINTVPPPYGNLRVRGIDVYQTVQPNSGAQMFGFPSGAFPSLPGGGTPTSYHLIGLGGILSTFTPQQAQYAGVTLDSLKQTTAVVYVNTTTGPAGDPTLPLQVTLTALRGGKQVGQPLVRTITNPPQTSDVVVSAFDRKRTGVFFNVPAEWLAGGKLDLQASVNFEPGQLGATYGRRECDTPCASDDTFTLKGVPAEGLPQLVIASIQLKTAGQANMPAPTTVLSAARKLIPGGERMVVLPYQATLDITTEAGLTGAVTPSPPGSPVAWTCNGATYTAPNFTSLGQVNRACRIAAVGARVMGWMATNPARELVQDGLQLRLIEHYDILFAGHNYPTGAGGTEPGWENNGNITDVSDIAPLGPGPFIAITTASRPLTAAAHELGHALSAPHADQTCGGNSSGQVGEPWAPDNRGRLEGTAFIQPSFVGRSFQPAVVNIDDPTQYFYDLMSYCASNNDTSYRNPADAWLGAYNWNRFFSRLRAFGSRVGYLARPSETTFSVLGRGARSAQAARAARPSRNAVAVGTVGDGGGAIMRVDPPDPERADVPSTAASSVRLRSLTVAGKVLLDAGATVNTPADQPAGGPASFVGPVDPRAASVELIRDGAVLDTWRRGAPVRVSLRAPRAGTRVRRAGALTVRWATSGGVASERSASVLFSADGGRTWQTVFDGADHGAARIDGRRLPGTRDGRVRVIVRDRLVHGVATSGTVRADGTPPVVTINAPIAGQPLLAGDRVLLDGSALSDAGVALRGRQLRWYAGRRALGFGGTVGARLSPGTFTLRLVGRGARGATGVASLRVQVQRRPLRVLALRFPRIVAAKATSVSGTLTTSDPAVLTSGRRTVAVGRKARRVTLDLPAQPASGLVRAVYTLKPAGRDVGGVVRGTVEVVRP